MSEISRRTFLQGACLAGVNITTGIELFKTDSNSIFKDLFINPNLENKDLEALKEFDSGEKIIQEKIEKVKQKIYITIDDGPSSYMIPMANELEKYNHRGIFFLLGGNIKHYKNQVIEILDRGHQVANHSWSHPAFAKLNLEKAKNEVKKTDDLLRNTISLSKQDPKQLLLFRYPYGSPISNKFKEQFYQFLIENNYFGRPLMWDVDTNDWRPQKTIGEIISSTINTKEDRVVLMHERKKTLEALRIFAKKLYENDKIGVPKTKLI